MKESIDVHKVFADYFDVKALAYAVSSRLGDGHICIDIEDYIKIPEINEINPFFEDEADFRNQTKEGKFVTHSAIAVKPFVIYRGKAYLHRYFLYETQILENIKRLGAKFKIITGGPGTGKTYGVSTELVRLFGEQPNLKVALAAPTGKAAARVNESIKNFAESSGNTIKSDIREKLTGLKAKTIHRLLGSVNNSVFFKYNENKRMPYDVVIIDECSMIDGAMMAKLLNAVADSTQLYLLGDKDQLASVESGSVFGDMCRAYKSSLMDGKIEFKKNSYRFDASKGIGKFSQEVIGGTFDHISAYNQDEQIYIDTTYDPGLFKDYALEYTSFILEKDIKKALGLMNQVRFLCVTRENENSVAETNKKIESILKKEINDLLVFNPKGSFYHNQPIIITQNNYELNIFNGDVGLIRREGDRLVAYFESVDGAVRKIPAGYLSNYDTVFAMTIHKSQGSEFDHVVVILPEKHAKKLLTRELLYTGVTRAKTKVLIQTTEKTLMECVQQGVVRSSGLEQRLTEREML